MPCKQIISRCLNCSPLQWVLGHPDFADEFVKAQQHPIWAFIFLVCGPYQYCHLHVHPSEYFPYVCIECLFCSVSPPDGGADSTSLLHSQQQIIYLSSWGHTSWYGREGVLALESPQITSTKCFLVAVSLGLTPHPLEVCCCWWSQNQALSHWTEGTEMWSALRQNGLQVGS